MNYLDKAVIKKIYKENKIKQLILTQGRKKENAKVALAMKRNVTSGWRCGEVVEGFKEDV